MCYKISHGLNRLSQFFLFAEFANSANKINEVYQ